MRFRHLPEYWRIFERFLASCPKVPLSKSQLTASGKAKILNANFPTYFTILRIRAACICSLAYHTGIHYGPMNDLDPQALGQESSPIIFYPP